MEIEGKIIVALPEQSGVSAKGNNWKKREYVLETHETYPKKIYFDLFGDRADQYPLAVGDEIRLSFDINSREHNGRWFTSVSGWKVDKVGAPATVVGPTDAPIGYGAPVQAPTPDISANEPSDDLPF